MKQQLVQSKFILSNLEQSVFKTELECWLLNRGCLWTTLMLLWETSRLGSLWAELNKYLERSWHTPPFMTTPLFFWSKQYYTGAQSSCVYPHLHLFSYGIFHCLEYCSMPVPISILFNCIIIITLFEGQLGHFQFYYMLSTRQVFTLF